MRAVRVLRVLLLVCGVSGPVAVTIFWTSYTPSSPLDAADALLITGPVAMLGTILALLGYALPSDTRLDPLRDASGLVRLAVGSGVAVVAGTLAAGVLSTPVPADNIADGGLVCVAVSLCWAATAGLRRVVTDFGS